MPLEAIEPRERLVVDFVDLTARAPGSVIDERWERAEIEHPEAALGLGIRDEAGVREKTVIRFARE